MNLLLLLIILILAIPVLLYAFAPAVLFRQVQAAIRRKGRLVRKTVRVGDIEWPYLEGGPKDGEVVVLVHGFGADKDHWSMAAPHITDRYRLIAPDLPGFGENDLSLARSYRIKAQADRLVEFLDALGIEKCHLGGNSMGGFIALQAALDHPDRLKSLTLVNNAGVVGSSDSELQQAVAAGENPLVMRELGDVDGLMAFVMHKPRAIPGQFKKVMFHEAKRREALLDKVFEDIILDALEAPATDRLGEVQTRTLIIWGKHDRVIDVSCVPVLEQGIKDAQAVVFDHVGHLPMMEDPEAFAKAHIGFLARA
ncbi:MAG: lipase 1 [Pseudomonadota bacterium]|jgi:pimeloyl-ACP methyl ester carboxylesterase